MLCDKPWRRGMGEEECPVGWGGPITIVRSIDTTEALRRLQDAEERASELDARDVHIGPPYHVPQGMLVEEDLRMKPRYTHKDDLIERNAVLLSEIHDRQAIIDRLLEENETLREEYEALRKRAKPWWRRIFGG